VCGGKFADCSKYQKSTSDFWEFDKKKCKCVQQPCNDNKVCAWFKDKKPEECWGFVIDGKYKMPETCPKQCGLCDRNVCGGKVQYCGVKYNDMKEFDFDKCACVKRPMVSEKEKKAIVDMHNDFRSAIRTRPRNLPTAKNMLKMHWNDKIAAYAQKYADQCIYEHDDGDVRSRGTGLGITIGQNLAFNQKHDWAFTMRDQWHAEIKDFSYGYGSTGGVVTHFTAMVQEKTTHVGCGYQFCPNLRGSGSSNVHYYVCNYAYLQIDVERPYASGATCSGCPGHCDDKGLCDCGDKICAGGGTLDPKTCKCDGDTGSGGGGGDDNKYCVDFNSKCKSWAGRGECTKNPKYMNPNCRKSCKKCHPKGCKNTGSSDENCKSWALRGECVNNPGWMPKNCALACNACN